MLKSDKNVLSHELKMTILQASFYYKANSLIWFNPVGF